MSAPTPFLAFATDDRVIGVLSLPLTGNPYAAVGVVAHPGPVTGLAVAATGDTLFTCGLEAPQRAGTAAAASSGGNGSVCIWRFDAVGLARQAAAGGSGAAPYLTLLEGGAEGEMYQAICDMFSYAQIRSQGEKSTARRRAGITLPLTEVASVMRALGYYPTASDVAALLNEARALNTARLARGEAAAYGITSAEQIDLQTLVQMYVNHRPVVSVGSDDLTGALTKLARHVARTEGLGGRDVGSGGAGGSDMFHTIRWGALTNLLQSGGEHMASTELRTCLTALLGPPGGGAGGGGGGGGRRGGRGETASHFDDDADLDVVGDIVSTVLGFQ